MVGGTRPWALLIFEYLLYVSWSLVRTCFIDFWENQVTDDVRASGESARSTVFGMGGPHILVLKVAGLRGQGRPHRCWPCLRGSWQSPRGWHGEHPTAMCVPCAAHVFLAWGLSVDKTSLQVHGGRGFTEQEGESLLFVGGVSGQAGAELRSAVF